MKLINVNFFWKVLLSFMYLTEMQTIAYVFVLIIHDDRMCYW